MLTAAALLALSCLVWPSAAGRVTVEQGRMPPVPAPPWRRGPGVTLRVAPLRGAVRRSPRHPWVAEFADVVAVGLDAGLDLPSAALASARSPGVAAPAPWLCDVLSTSLADGRGVATLLDGGAPVSVEERRDLGLLVAAWRLAEDVGATASAVTAAAAGSIRGRQAARERAGVAVAGPRASMWLLSALPLAGPVAGTLVGVGPDRLYSSGPARLLALAGLALTAGGWWWARTLLRRALRPGRTDGGRQ